MTTFLTNSNDLYNDDGNSNSVFGFGGNDTIRGEDGEDNLFGGWGHDRLEGGSDDDRIGGGWGNDTIEGDYGDDVIWGGPGSDLLTGGCGDDTFIFGARSDRGDGVDTITDFNQNGDDWYYDWYYDEDDQILVSWHDTTWDDMSQNNDGENVLISITDSEGEVLQFVVLGQTTLDQGDIFFL